MKKRKVTIILGLLLIITCIIFIVLNSMNLLRSQDGYFKDNIYHNDYFNMNLVVPKNYSYSPNDEIGLINSQLSQYNINKIYLFNMKEKNNDRVIVEALAEKLSLLEKFNHKMFVDKKIADLKKTLIEIEVNDLGTIEIDEIKFTILKIYFDPVPELKYICFYKGYAIEIIMNSDTALDEVEAIIKTIEFK
ncbi:MAG: hypothetical protein ACYDEX_09515 [Mobilitalea sp.]